MQRHTISAVLAALGLTLAAGAATGLVFAGPQEETPQEGQEEVTEEVPERGPVVAGRVTFKGDIPEPKELAVPAQAADGCCPPGEKVDRTDMSLLIDKERGLANVVVTVKVEGAKVELPEEPFEVDQKGCRFIPHLQIVPKGAKVEFLNSDETAHNVRLVTLVNDPLNQVVPAGAKVARTFEEPERIKVECDMHTWMRSWVVVTDATHWAVSDATGAFELEGLPAGDHEVTLWHESLGSKTAKVSVAEDGTAAPIEVTMEKAKKKGPRRRR